MPNELMGSDATVPETAKKDLRVMRNFSILECLRMDSLDLAKNCRNDGLSSHDSKLIVRLSRVRGLTRIHW